MSKSEKIDLIKRIQSGDIPLIINGEVIDDGVILIEKDGEYYLHGFKINMKEFAEKFTGTAIILPYNGKDEL